MQVLIPMAAKSAFFPPEQFFFPKPLIEVDGRPMIERVIGGLDRTLRGCQYFFVVSSEDVASYSLDGTLKLLAGEGSTILPISAPTRGGLCSALLAADRLNFDDEIIIMNGDQIIDVDYNTVAAYFRSRNADAGTITFDSVHPRWSYAKLDENKAVSFTAEKRVVSRNAIAGFYYFKTAQIFFEAAEQVLRKDISVNGQYYLSSALNEVILAGKTVAAYTVASDHYHSFYSPEKIREFEDRKHVTQAPDAKKTVNVVIPAAGQGSRFAKAGYADPKPFIDVQGQMMIDLVVDNMKLEDSRVHALLREEHMSSRTQSVEQLRARGIAVHPVRDLTEGTACTLLLAREVIDNDSPMLVANSDQYVEFDVQAFVNDCIERDLDGSILVFRDSHRDPKWSFAKLDENGLVTEVAEKKPISDLATVGIYLFRRGSDFVASAIDMIVRNERVNGEFYTCPVYNYMIAKGMKIGVFEVPQEAMHGLGTPEDLDTYLAKVAAR